MLSSQKKKKKISRTAENNICIQATNRTLNPTNSAPTKSCWISTTIFGCHSGGPILSKFPVPAFGLAWSWHYLGTMALF